MAIHNDTGKAGEKAAVQFLEQKGYEVLDENWVFGKSEVDIVALKSNTIIFIEVKTRSSIAFGMPEDFVKSAKQRQLELAAQAYIEIMDHKGEIRFDIIAVLITNDNQFKINHIEDAFGRMRRIILFLLLSITLCQFACSDKVGNYITFKNPLQGESFHAGKPVKIELDIPEKTEVQSISYLVDGKQFAQSTTKAFVTLDTQNLPLGYRLLTAIVKSGDKTDTITNNIILTTDRKPVKLKYTLVNTFPHDTSAYTQGLSFVNGKLLESTRRKGQSQLKYVDLKTRKATKVVPLKPQYFGEGSVKVGNKIIVLTWEENLGLVYDANTLEEIATFPYQSSREGWGLTYDGKQLLRSDGSNKIWFMNADTYVEEGFIEVYDNKGVVERLNELEFIDGKLYANVYGSDKIVVIDTKTGVVTAEVDLSKLLPKSYFKNDDDIANNVLNGIAYDEIGKRLFVTCKKWPKLFEIKLSEK